MVVNASSLKPFLLKLTAAAFQPNARLAILFVSKPISSPTAMIPSLPSSAIGNPAQTHLRKALCASSITIAGVASFPSLI